MLELAVRADNAGADAIGDLTLGVTIGSAVRSRTAYETSLTEGPDLPIFAVTLPEKDTVEPGGTRRFRIPPVDLSTIGGISRTDSLVYPMRVDLRSAGVTGRRDRHGGDLRGAGTRGAAAPLDDDRDDRAARVRS